MGAGQCGIPRELAERITRDYQIKSNTYYCNTLSIKGFGSCPDVGSLTAQARQILRPLELEEMLNNNLRVKIMRGEGEAALRITYKTHQDLVVAQGRFGAAVNGRARRGQPQISIRVNQLVPPRFAELRTKWNALAPHWKRQGKIKNFSFCVVKGQFMLRASEPGRTPTLFAFPEADNQPEASAPTDVGEDNAMDQGSGLEEQAAPGGASAENPDLCGICQASLGVVRGSTARMNCGHAFHKACLLTNLVHGALSCPTCRAPYAERRIDCGPCRDTFERTGNTEDWCVSWCGHLHFRSCLDTFLNERFGRVSRNVTPDMVLAGHGAPGCELCRAQPEARPRSILDGIFDIDEERPYDHFTPAAGPSMASLVYRQGELFPQTSRGTGSNNTRNPPSSSSTSSSAETHRTWSSNRRNNNRNGRRGTRSSPSRDRARSPRGSRDRRGDQSRRRRDSGISEGGRSTGSSRQSSRGPGGRVRFNN